MMSNDGQPTQPDGSVPPLAPPGGLELRVIVLPPTTAVTAPSLDTQEQGQERVRAEARADVEAARQHQRHDRAQAEATRLVALDRALMLLRPTERMAEASAQRPDEVLQLAARVYDWVAHGRVSGAGNDAGAGHGLPPSSDVAADVAEWLRGREEGEARSDGLLS